MDIENLREVLNGTMSLNGCINSSYGLPCSWYIDEDINQLAT